MLFLFSSAALLIAQAERSTVSDIRVAHGYRIFASLYEGRCGYGVNDVVGMSAKQLRETLSKGYDPGAGLQILVDRDTPPGCARKARRVASGLGFHAIFVRPAEDEDRQGGIP